jgi:DNA-binding NarL/FixJ family response regulator
MLIFIASGRQTKDFAKHYGVAVKTAEQHRYQLMKNIDCHNVAQCTKYALIHKYISLSNTP